MSYQQGNFKGKKDKSTKDWQELWEQKGIHQADDKKAPKEYVLVEFPYPSSSGLHVGHAFSFTGADVYARFRRMQGYNILFPMGWDAFGLPTENYAIKTKKNPQEITKQNTARFKEQMKELGFSFDWEREVNTTNPDYYKWTQWIFIQLFKKGLAYKKEMPINWCPSCKIGLANEEVVDGRCERCGAETKRRNISQWIVKITAYADRLIKGLEKTDFVEKVKTAQINWIGKSVGAKIDFQIKNSNKVLEIFTTRPDTLWGSTFMVVAPEHWLVNDVLKTVSEKKKEQIKNYLEKALKKSDLERTELLKKKTGIFTGYFALNPANNQEIPIWISDFVLGSYGTGAIMAVPAHDQRDWEFAQKYDLEIIPVIKPEQNWDFDKAAYTEVAKGKLINSKPINGLSPEKAFQKTLQWLEKKRIGQKAENYHLRDWIFSRQHYWGEPIPLVFCKNCAEKIKNQKPETKNSFKKGELLNPGWVPVPEIDLPVILPEVKNYQAIKTGESPLTELKEWVNTTCPQCGGEAKRETDIMPNWAGSDWYFLRYIDPHNKKVLADLKRLKNWLPVDIYIGGDEHNTLHLLYSRFIYQFLWDIGAVPKEYPEPYQRRVSHGVILGPDNQRMSKSRGNVIIPEQVLKRFKKYGADILRLYLMFIGPFDKTMAWNDNALIGVKKFLDKVENYIDNWSETRDKLNNQEIDLLIHQTIKKVTEDIQKLRFNTAVACLMEFLNEIKIKGKKLKKQDLEKFIILCSVFVPFFAEEQWQKLNPEKKEQSIFQEKWPDFNPELAQEKEIELVVQINGKVRDKVLAPAEISEQEAKKMVLEREKVKRYLKQKEIKKIIFVPKKLINFVIKEDIKTKNRASN